MGALKIAAWQVWQLRPSAEGGARLLSAMNTKEAQEREMDYWTEKLPDATLVYRTRRYNGLVEQELPLDRTLATLPRRTAWTN